MPPNSQHDKTTPNVPREPFLKRLKVALQRIGFSLGCGVVISLIGVLIASLTHRWSISYTWFTLFGFLCAILAAAPFVNGRYLLKSAWRSTKRVPRHAFNYVEALDWAIICVCIGLPNIVVPLVVFYVFHPH